MLQFTDLPPASALSKDVVSLRLTPLFMESSPVHAEAWKRRILVLCARRLSVAGSSWAVLSLQGDDITDGIARVLALALPDLDLAATVLDEAIESARTESTVHATPAGDFTPQERTPSPSPVPGTPHAPSASANPALLAAIAEMGRTIGGELARALSASLPLGSPASAHGPDLERTLQRHLDAQREYLSSHAPAHDDPMAAHLRQLPVEYRWPKEHDDAPLFRRALAAVARVFAQLIASGSVPSFVDYLAADLRASGRNLSVADAALLQAAGVGLAPATCALLVAELSVLADRTMPEGAIHVLRLARVVRPRSVAEVTAARRGDFVSGPPGLERLPIADKKAPAQAQQQANAKKPADTNQPNASQKKRQDDAPAARDGRKVSQ